MKEFLKGLIFKKKPSDKKLTEKSDPRDPRRSNEPMACGSCKGEFENPYLTARRTWNDHVGSVMSQNVSLRIGIVLALLITLAAVGGVIHIGSQSKFVPYLVEVDKAGATMAAGPVTAASHADARIIRAAVSDFVQNARLVTPDIALQRKAVFRVYSMLSPNDPATTKMNEYLNGNADASPFRRAAKEIVNTDIKAVLQQTPDTWQVEWEETTRDRQGALKDRPIMMRALVTAYQAEVSTNTSNEQLLTNPMSIFIRDFSWTRIP